MIKQMSVDRASRSEYDLALVGSGLSSSFTLLGLLNEIDAVGVGRPLRLALLEKADDFFKGIPYGTRLGMRSLIITPVKEFLPPVELERFMAWLAERADWAISEMEQLDGTLTKDLLRRCSGAIKAGDCSDFHMPRHFFGVYLAEKVAGRLEDAERRGLAVCDFLQNEVTAIQREGDRYHLQIAAQDEPWVESRQVVLALGTAAQPSPAWRRDRGLSRPAVPGRRPLCARDGRNAGPGCG